MSDTVIIIPAHNQLIPYPAKLLAILRCANEAARNLIARSVIAGRKAIELVTGEIGLYVATDDGRIAGEVRPAVSVMFMTSASCRKGTNMANEAIGRTHLKLEIITNLQDDAPRAPSHFHLWLLNHMHGGL